MQKCFNMRWTVSSILLPNKKKKKKEKKHFIASFGRVRETEVENQQLGEQFTIR